MFFNCFFYKNSSSFENGGNCDFLIKFAFLFNEMDIRKCVGENI